jgi:hypothetical protein
VPVRSLTFVSIFAIIGLLGGCEKNAASDGEGSSGADSDTSRQARLDRLRAMPYVDVVRSDKSNGRTGLVRFDPQASYPGYNLYSTHALTTAVLIDERGNRINEWSLEGSRHWAHVRLLPDGDLLVVGSTAAEEEDFSGGDSRFLARLAWDGTLKWRTAIAAHHDAEMTPSGKILALTFAYRQDDAIHRRVEFRDNALTLIDPDTGEPLESKSLYDMFSARPDIYTFHEVRPIRRRGRRTIDLFHGNSVEWMHRENLFDKNEIYGPDNVLVCMRHQDAIAIVNWPRGEVIWTWGQKQLSGPHDASVLENGHILVFDNGVEHEPQYSRVLEMDPLSGEIVWEYKASEPTLFFTLTRGSCQRLPNGNTLIADSEGGRAFEVTPDGRTVWEYVAPETNEEGKRTTIVRMTRYETSFVEGLIERYGAPAANREPR